MSRVGISVREVIIANGESLSAAANSDGLPLCGIIMPGTWTAAGLTFQFSHDGGVTFTNVYDDATTDTELTIGTSTSRWIKVEPMWFGFTHIKVRSGTAGTAVNQAGARTIKLIFAGL